MINILVFVLFILFGSFLVANSAILKCVINPEGTMKTLLKLLEFDGVLIFLFGVIMIVRYLT